MDIKSGKLLILTLLFCFCRENETTENCCSLKVVGGKTYIFSRENKKETEKSGCKDSCVYTSRDDESATPSEICFKSGELNAMCVEEAVLLGGCIDQESKFPIEWIPLLEDPCIYLKGPECPCPCCDSSPAAEKIGIVGGGMAGLTMAWILQHIGHEVTILEATDRVGGRAFTYHGHDHDWYGDLGAMRFPPEKDQPLTYQLFKQFNIPLADFTNTNQGTSSYFYVNGKYFSSKSYEDNDQEVLKFVYETFGINTNVTEGTFPRFLNGSLENPSGALLDKYLPKPEDITKLCLKDETLNRLYETALKKANLPKKLIPLWSVLELERAFLPYSAYQHIFDTPKEKEKRANEENEQFKEVVGGVSVLPDKIFQNITNQDSLKDVQIKFNSTVDQITINENKKVSLQYKDGTVYPVEFDKVVLTPTSRVVSSMKFSPRLAYEKTYALDSFYFMNSVKVFLAFHTPFWANDTKIPAIPFDSTTTPNGGSGITDLPIRSLYYPSHPFHGFSILVSYVWSEDADRLTALSDEDLIQESLANLVEIHGEIARTQYKEGKVQKWMEESWTAGAFAWSYPGQFHELLPALQAHHMGKVFFAGEYTSKFDHGWIQAAAESACRVSDYMFGWNGENKCK